MVAIRGVTPRKRPAIVQPKPLAAMETAYQGAGLERMFDSEESQMKGRLVLRRHSGPWSRG